MPSLPEKPDKNKRERSQSPSPRLSREGRQILLGAADMEALGDVPRAAPKVPITGEVVAGWSRGASPLPVVPLALGEGYYDASI
jgi:hypothetical protein